MLLSTLAGTAVHQDADGDESVHSESGHRRRVLPHRHPVPVDDDGPRPLALRQRHVQSQTTPYLFVCFFVVVFFVFFSFRVEETLKEFLEAHLAYFYTTDGFFCNLAAFYNLPIYGWLLPYSPSSSRKSLVFSVSSTRHFLIFLLNDTLRPLCRTPVERSDWFDSASIL